MYETRDHKLKQDMFYKYEYLVQRSYLHELFCLPMGLPPDSYKPIQLLKIESLPETSIFMSFSYILNALGSLGETIGFIITCNGGTLSLYLGIKEQGSTAFSLLQNGLKQTFPNGNFYSIENSCTFLDNLFNPKNYPYLTSSLVTLNPSYNSIFLRDFTNLVGNASDYVALFLAEPIKHSDIRKRLQELYEIYDVLSYFSQSNYTHYKSDANSNSHAKAQSNTTTSSESATTTCGNSNTETCSNYANISASTPLSLQINRSLPSSNSINPTTSSALTTKIEQNAISSAPKNINTTALFNKGTSSSCAQNNSEANAQTCSESNCVTSTHTNSMTHTIYQALSFSCPNKRLLEAVASLNTAINRYNTLSRNTTFNFSTYFFSPSQEISLRAAYSYIGLSQSIDDLSPNLVNCMASNQSDYANLYKFLRSFTSPDFLLPQSNLLASNSVPLVSSELLNSLYLPITQASLTPP